jgi:hypothetical protein
MKKHVFSAGFALVVGLAVAAVAAQNPPAAAQAPAPKKAATPTPPACGPTPPATLKNVATGSRCFELRIYTLRPGGAGDLELLHRRFKEAALPAFKRHNMEVVGFWQPVSRQDQLVFILGFKDAAAKDAAWAAFNADPVWMKARTEMNVELTADSTPMIATEYGPVK